MRLNEKQRFQLPIRHKGSPEWMATPKETLRKLLVGQLLKDSVWVFDIRSSLKLITPQPNMSPLDNLPEAGGAARNSFRYKKNKVSNKSRYTCNCFQIIRINNLDLLKFRLGKIHLIKITIE